MCLNSLGTVVVAKLTQTTNGTDLWYLQESGVFIKKKYNFISYALNTKTSGAPLSTVKSTIKYCLITQVQYWEKKEGSIKLSIVFVYLWRNNNCIYLYIAVRIA